MEGIFSPLWRIPYPLPFPMPSGVSDILFYSTRAVYITGRVVSRVDQSCETRVLFGEGIFPSL
jgi:hypothetical protein